MTAERDGVRRFTISDGMILVAALGVGLAWTAKLVPYMFKASPVGGGIGVPQLAGWEPLFKATILAMPTLMVLTLTMPILRFRGPRPPWRRLAGQPGVTATLAGLLTIFACAGLYFGTAAVYSRPVLPNWRAMLTVEFFVEMVEVLMIAAPLIGLAVASAWASLLWQRRWRCEASWVDRLGRAVGVGWVGMIPVMGLFWMGYLLR
jgi:hypothetical protein